MSGMQNERGTGQSTSRWWPRKPKVRSYATATAGKNVREDENDEDLVLPHRRPHTDDFKERQPAAAAVSRGVSEVRTTSSPAHSESASSMNMTFTETDAAYRFRTANLPSQDGAMKATESDALRKRETKGKKGRNRKKGKKEPENVVDCGKENVVDENEGPKENTRSKNVEPSKQIQKGEEKNEVVSLSQPATTTVISTDVVLDNVASATLARTVASPAAVSTAIKTTADGAAAPEAQPPSAAGVADLLISKQGLSSDLPKHLSKDLPSVTGLTGSTRLPGPGTGVTGPPTGTRPPSLTRPPLPPLPPAYSREGHSARASPQVPACVQRPVSGPRGAAPESPSFLPWARMDRHALPPQPPAILRRKPLDLAPQSTRARVLEAAVHTPSPASFPAADIFSRSVSIDVHSAKETLANDEVSDALFAALCLGNADDVKLLLQREALSLNHSMSHSQSQSTPHSTPPTSSCIADTGSTERTTAAGPFGVPDTSVGQAVTDANPVLREDSTGRNCAHYAATGGSVACFDLLIGYLLSYFDHRREKSGTEEQTPDLAMQALKRLMNVKDSNGWSPLILSICRKKTALALRMLTVKVGLEEGCKRLGSTVRRELGQGTQQSAPEQAVNVQADKEQPDGDESKQWNYLIEADVWHEQDGQKLHALHFASQSALWPVVQCLIDERQIPLNLKDSAGRNLCHHLIGRRGSSQQATTISHTPTSVRAGAFGPDPRSNAGSSEPCRSAPLSVKQRRLVSEPASPAPAARGGVSEMARSAIFAALTKSPRFDPALLVEPDVLSKRSPLFLAILKNEPFLVSTIIRTLMRPSFNCVRTKARMIAMRSDEGTNQENERRSLVELLFVKDSERLSALELAFDLALYEALGAIANIWTLYRDPVKDPPSFAKALEAPHPVHPSVFFSGEARPHRGADLAKEPDPTSGSAGEQHWEEARQSIFADRLLWARWTWQDFDPVERQCYRLLWHHIYGLSPLEALHASEKARQSFSSSNPLSSASTQEGEPRQRSRLMSDAHLVLVKVVRRVGVEPCLAALATWLEQERKESVRLSVSDSQAYTHTPTHTHMDKYQDIQGAGPGARHHFPHMPVPFDPFLWNVPPYPQSSMMPYPPVMPPPYPSVGGPTQPQGLSLATFIQLLSQHLVKHMSERKARGLLAFVELPRQTALRRGKQRGRPYLAR